MTIVLERRSNDWKVFVKGNPGIWECAVNREEAIGKLIVTLVAIGLMPEGLKFESSFQGGACGSIRM